MLTTNAREQTCSDGVGTYLTGKVYLYSRVYRHHLRVLTYDKRIIRPCHISEHHVLVVVHIVVEGSRTESERGYTLARHDDFLRVVDDSALDKRQHTVGHCLRMQTKILMVMQSVEHGIRYSANANLQRCTIRNQFGYKLSDILLLLVRHSCRHFNQWVVHLHAGINVIDMDKRITVRERHLLVHLCDDDLRTLSSTESKVARYSVAAVAFLVWRRDIEQSNIKRQIAIAEQSWHFAQEARYDLCLTTVYCLADAVGNEQTARNKFIA